MRSPRQRILDAVLDLYPTRSPAWSRVGIEIECFVRDCRRVQASWGWHQRLQDWIASEVLPHTRTIDSLALEPGAQWEVRSRPLDGRVDVARFGVDVRAIADALADRGCLVAFQGIRPGGPRQHILSPCPRSRILRDYLQHQGRWSLAMMADTAALQLTLDAEPLAFTLNLLRIVCSRRDEVAAGIGKLNRAEIWRDVDPERCVPPRALLAGLWSDEACLDYVLSRPSICAEGPAGTLQRCAGNFYDVMLERRDGLDQVERQFTMFMKQIYFPVKPRVKPELREMDSRPPEAFGDAIDLLVELGVPVRSSRDFGHEGPTRTPRMMKAAIR